MPDGRVINVLNNTNRGLGIYNKRTKKISFCKPTITDNKLIASGICNDIDGGPRFFPNMQVNDSTMLMWINAADFKTHVESDDFKNSIAKYPEKKNYLKKMADKLSPMDNPILMFVTFN